MHRHIKLRHLLFISFILISILPVLSLAVWVQQTAYEKEVAAVTDKHLLLAKNITSALSRYVIDVEATFRYVSGGDIIANSSNELVDMLKLVEFRRVCVIDSLGNVESKVASLSQSSDATSLSPALMSRLQGYFEQADNNPATVVFTDVIANQQNQPTIFLIMAKANNRYTVGALSTKYIVDVAKAISFGDKGHSAIVDRTGRLLAHPNKDWRQQMKDISKVSAVSKMMLGETGVETFFSPALKADMIAGYTTVPETGWGVMVPQPVAELKIRARQVGEVMYYIVALGLIFSGLISWLLARYISRPIQNVVEAVEQVSQGNYNAKIRDSVNVIPQELNVLTSSFNTMIDDMGDYENQLRYQASFDQLTNLPNRWLFIDRLEQAIGDALRQKTLVSLLFLDLDRFKVVNDTHGHEVGGCCFATGSYKASRLYS